MRMNYKTYPTDYIQKLKTISRKKARCFMDYWDDMEHGDHNSYGFYAKGWKISKSTAYEWITEFKYEIDLFISHWFLKNEQHYSYAENQAERLPNDSRTQTHQTQPNNTSFKESNKTTAERSPNKALNNYNNNTSKNFNMDKDYIDFYFVYKCSTNYPGNKAQAYPAFALCDVNVNLLKIAAMKYLHDPVVNKPVGIKKFIEGELYQPYLPTYIRVKLGDKTYEGEYNSSTYEFKDADGKSLGTIEPSLLVELFEKEELKYITKLKEAS